MASYFQMLILRFRSEERLEQYASEDIDNLARDLEGIKLRREEEVQRCEGHIDSAFTESKADSLQILAYIYSLKTLLDREAPDLMKDYPALEESDDAELGLFLGRMGCTSAVGVFERKDDLEETVADNTTLDTSAQDDDSPNDENQQGELMQPEVEFDETAFDIPCGDDDGC